MQQIINLREANQNLSKYIKLLKNNDEIVITKHGKAVAKLIPVTEEKILNLAQQDALQRLLNRIKEGYHLGGEGVSRDKLYER
jgi:prevent-host-death family protein